MKIFAHRGASGDYPENTILAFKKALEIGVDGIELDVHKSKDGELIVIHDEDVQRTFKGKGLIKDYTLGELQELKCRKFEFVDNDECRICTLGDIIELIKDEDIVLNIEAKTDEIHYDLEKDVLRLISNYKVKNKILLSSFYHQTIKNFKKIDSSINYGALYHVKQDYEPEENIVEHAKKVGLYSINMNVELVTKEIVELAHDNGLKVFVYTVNSPDIMRKLIEFKVDGVFTDFPDLMKEVLNNN